MSVQIRLLGGFEVARDDVRVRGRRLGTPPGRTSSCSSSPSPATAGCTASRWSTPCGPGCPGTSPGLGCTRRPTTPDALSSDPGAVVLRHELVALFPERDDVEVDVREFTRAATRALQSGDETLAAEALTWYAGPLLPDDPYEPWTDEPRRAARAQHLDLLRLLGRWDDAARRGAGRRGGAPRPGPGPRRRRRRPRAPCVQLERLEQALRGSSAPRPGAEALRLRDELERRAPRPRRARPSPAPADGAPAVRLFGRRDVGDRIRAVLDEAGAGRGVTVLVAGPAGVGKSAVLDLADALARRQGWKVARGGASSVEGPWPYSPVLEALSALCRRHPALLDGLADDYRAEIEQALTGRDLGWTGENSHQRLFVAAAELMRVAAAGAGLLLMVDDVHDADEASLRLLHYLSRCAVDERVVLVLAHRDPAPARVQDVTASMVSRGGGHLIELQPLTTAGVAAPAPGPVPRAGPGRGRGDRAGGGRASVPHDRDGASAG